MKRNEPLFQTVPGLSHAAEGQFHAAGRAVIIDEDLAEMQCFRHPLLTRPVTRPDRGDKAVWILTDPPWHRDAVGGR